MGGVERTPPEKLPQSSLRDASPLKDGALGITVQFPAEVQSLRIRQRLPLRGSWQSRQALTEGVETLRKEIGKKMSKSVDKRPGVWYYT